MKTRKIKKLLILLRDYLPTVSMMDMGGICPVVGEMCDRDIITSDEWEELYHYLQTRYPRRNSNYPYYWKVGKLEPRMKFLNKLIAEL